MNEKYEKKNKTKNTGILEHQSSRLNGGINKKQSTGLEWKRAVPCPTQPVKEQFWEEIKVCPANVLL